jgi:hypothetical protein
MLLILVVLWTPHRALFNYMGCPGYPAWEVDYNQTSLIRDAEVIQEWLHARQFSSWRCHQYGPDPFLPAYGIGNTYLRAVIALSKDIGKTIIHRNDLCKHAHVEM